MGKIRRKFEPEFKRQMVEQVETGQVTMAQAAREYQISRSLIERWRKQYRSNVSALADQPSRQERQLEAENEKLKAKIGDLVMQIEHLKNCKFGFDSGKAPIRPRSPRTTWISFESVPSDRLGAQQLLLQAGPIGPAAA